MTKVRELLIIVCTLHISNIRGREIWDKDHLHPRYVKDPDTHNDWVNPPEDRIYTDWYELDQRRIQNALEQMQRMRDLHKPAKNVILIMGDGLGISTLSAARIYMAQQRNLTGEDAQLSWERLPYSAISRTYTPDKMVSDSAATATAMLCGEKTNNNIVALNQNASVGDCDSATGNELKSILHHSMDEGKWTGFVTNARVSHASPAPLYAHSVDRYWESDADVPVEIRGQCPDVASQLIDEQINHDIRVILSGGRRLMLPNTVADPEYPELTGSREDNRNLIQEWLDIKEADGFPQSAYAYVDNLDDFNNIDDENIEYILGLFEHDHMQYEIDRESDTFGEPSLADMVEKAIKVLHRSEDGYFLFVEGSRIDHAHHDTMAHRALSETVALSDAVQRIMDLTSENDTLLVVTADHSHVFTISAYPDSHSNILSFSDNMVGEDDKPYATLGYTNGPGFQFHRQDVNGNEQPRLDLTDYKDLMENDPDFQFDAGIWLPSERHGGEDVGIFARGPMAHLFHGVQEQSYIGNLMMYASCVGRNKDLCETGVPDICT